MELLKNHLLGVLTLLAILVTVESVCDTKQHVDETCAKRMVTFGNRETIIPMDDESLKRQCAVHREAITCLIDYSKTCLTGLTASFSQTMNKNLDSHFRRRCEDPDFSAAYIEHNKCFQDASILEQFHKCEDIWYHHMEAIRKANLSSLTVRIEASCCVFHKFQTCVRQKNTDLCHDKNANFWDEALDEMSDEAVESVCNGYLTDKDCKANLPPHVLEDVVDPVAAMTDEQLKQRNGRYQSFVFSLYDMLTNYKLV